MGVRNGQWRENLFFSYKEEPLPYMPFCYKHPDYWHVIEKETKRTGDMINSRKLFDDSEKAHPITEDEMIKIEKIHGTVLLIGAEDDVLWDTAKYIRRMKQRMKEHSHTCRLDYVIYEHGTLFRFSGEHAKDNAPGWIRTLCETGISGSKENIRKNVAEHVWILTGG